MFILTTSVLLISLGFLVFVRSLVKANQTTELKNSEKKVFSSLTADSDDSAGVEDIPYFLTYIVYKAQSEIILITNDPFLPLLKDSNGKALRYYEKDFFFDGDLDILYYAETHILDGEEIVCAVANNIENDSFSIIFSKLPLALLLMSIPVLLISFFVALYITKNTINPVVKITKAAQSLTTENLAGLLPLTGRGDEIDDLSDTFNELFLRIKADFDRERQFSSDVAHELNTPLTVISGQANLLLRWGKENPEQLEKSLNAIKNESKSMHAIIENLLQISRIESGRIKPQSLPFNIKELFERVAEEFTSVAPEALFELKCQEEAETITTDAEMLHQVITVLVSNSVKFSEGKCKIILEAKKLEDGSLVISEEDDGPGIQDENLPHIFERFYRGDEAHTRKAGGSGLGLSIARTLTSALGAVVKVQKLFPHGVKFEIIFN